MYLQINTVKYDAEQEITNIYENSQIVWYKFFTEWYYSFIFGLLQISIGLSVFGFVANEYKRIAIHSLSNIRNIRSGIRWAKPKVILNYSTLPTKRYNTVSFWDISKLYRYTFQFSICTRFLYSKQYQTDWLFCTQKMI